MTLHFLTHPDNAPYLVQLLENAGCFNYSIRTDDPGLQKSTLTGFIITPDGTVLNERYNWKWRKFNQSHLPGLLALGLLKRQLKPLVFQLNQHNQWFIPNELPYNHDPH